MESSEQALRDKRWVEGLRKRSSFSRGERPTPEEQAKQEAEQEAREAEVEQEKLNKRLSELLYPAGNRYWKCTLENFVVEHPGQQAVVDALVEYRTQLQENVKAGVGIVLFGPTGTGKDHLLVALGRFAIEKHGLTVAWVYGPDLAACPFDRMDSTVSQYTYPSVLILSDPVVGAAMPGQMSLLARIIHRRDRMRRPIWATMNVRKGDEADANLGPALTDRLRDGAVTAFCGWQSYRKPQMAIGVGQQAKRGE